MATTAAAVARQGAAALHQQHRLVVRATYRHLFRAINTAFKNDYETLAAAREQARAEFRAPLKGALEGKDSEGSLLMAQRIEHAQGVTKILRENVVQGRRKDAATPAAGNQAQKEETAEAAVGEGEADGDTYVLRFTEDTQRFDNEDTKKLKGTTKSFKEIKDAQF